MDIPRESDAAVGPDGAKPAPEVSVHVLSEHAFCPRAAVISHESVDGGHTELDLGPRLDGWVDYDAHRFGEEIRAAWGALRLWLTLLAPEGILARPSAATK